MWLCTDNQGAQLTSLTYRQSLAGAVLADPGPMLARLVRGCIALAFTASDACPLINPATALLNPSRGGKLSYTTVAMEREHIVYSSDAADTGGSGPGRP